MLVALFTSELLQRQSHNQERSTMAGFASSKLFPILTEIMGKDKKKCKKKKLDSNVVHLFQVSQQHKRAMEPEVGKRVSALSVRDLPCRHFISILRRTARLES